MDPFEVEEMVKRIRLERDVASPSQYSTPTGPVMSIMTPDQFTTPEEAFFVGCRPKSLVVDSLCRGRIHCSFRELEEAIASMYTQQQLFPQWTIDDKCLLLENFVPIALVSSVFQSNDAMPWADRTENDINFRD